MYRGFSSFGYRLFVLYTSPDGSPEYFGMSENLYELETMKALLSELGRRNKSVKIDPYYQQLLDGNPQEKNGRNLLNQ